MHGIMAKKLVDVERDFASKYIYDNMDCEDEFLLFFIIK